MPFVVPAQIPTDPQKMAAWMRDALAQISADLREPNPEFITLQERHAAPDRLYTGLTVLADGSDWDPGSGAGVYTYYGAAWHKLG